MEHHEIHDKAKQHAHNQLISWYVAAKQGHMDSLHPYVQAYMNHLINGVENEDRRFFVGQISKVYFDEYKKHLPITDAEELRLFSNSLMLKVDFLEIKNGFESIAHTIDHTKYKVTITPPTKERIFSGQYKPRSRPSPQPASPSPLTIPPSSDTHRLASFLAKENMTQVLKEAIASKRKFGPLPSHWDWAIEHIDNPRLHREKAQEIAYTTYVQLISKEPHKYYDALQNLNKLEGVIQARNDTFKKISKDTSSGLLGFIKRALLR